MKLGEWEAAAVDPGEGPPTTDEWVAVDSLRPSRFAGEHAVAYRTSFADPRDGAGRALLELHGLSPRGRVWLNGDFYGTHDTPFTPFRSVFEPADRNELLVECRTPENRLDDAGETSPANEPTIPGVRRASVEPTPENVITDLTIRHYDTDDGSGVNAIVTVDAGTDLRDRIELSLRSADTDGMSALSHVGVTADAGDRVTVRGQLTVRDPDRWWPRGFGAQNRYTVHAALDESERTATTGFQTVESRSDGIVVNGTRVPIRGLCVRSPTPETVERALAANATLVRPVGAVPPPAFYDAADEAGLLICQDVPLDPGGLDVERPRRVARTLGGAYGHHPSLAGFGVRDDAARFESIDDEGDRYVLRATSGGDPAATATAAAEALPNDVPAFVFPGFDAGPEEVSSPTAWLLDGYAGADDPLDAGTHTRYVVPGADADERAERAGHALERLRESGRPIVTALPPATDDNDTDPIETAFAPVKAFLDESTPGETRAVVVNDTPEPATGDLAWTAGDADGALSVEIGPLSRDTVGEIDVPIEAHRVELSLSIDDHVVTTTVDR
ncbi:MULTISPECIES: glycoside hydrolase family 2 [Halococcus]|uniref:Glycoside hydrolase family 2 sugar binding protein n=1 Tax=Halococcus salifodinae DSM 8989 TaxID=1227456 RepID=M0N714_9EURY|nr:MULTISPECIES: glycoside hydrolase family 2 [Halococcus]EMA53348.1 glycoside hydrolase family 2 sugar binding protein [Halococcus salifodinae DSM 8989]